jgi:hypothetical protein
VRLVMADGYRLFVAISSFMGDTVFHCDASVPISCCGPRASAK